MKLGIETNYFREAFGDEEGLRMIAQAGFDTYDYSFYEIKNPENDMLGADYLEKARSLRALADELGLQCNQTHAPFEYDEQMKYEESDPCFLRIIRSFEFSQILGAQYSVVHCKGYDPDPDKLVENNLPFFKALEPYAAKAGIKIGLENLIQHKKDGPGFLGKMNTPESLHKMKELLNSNQFVYCVDIGHAVITGVDPAELILAHKDQLKILHIHDTDLINDSHLMPYLGKHDWNAIMASLKDIGYNGDFTFEIAKTFRYMDKELVLPTMKLAVLTGHHLIEKLK